MKRVAVAFSVLTVVGCNAILDNESGNLVVPEEAGTIPVEAGSPVDSAAAPSPVDASTKDASTGGCETSQHLCAGRCVSDDDPAYGCGSCAACPAPVGATATCAGNTCEFKCNAPLQACGGACIANDVMACGINCTPCATPPNATATCDGLACGFACQSGFADCDGRADNGCEVDVTKDNANCGACGTQCGLLLLCAAGSCKLLGL